MSAAPLLGRRERRKLELRGRILQAASDLFVQNGFHATKVSDVCERADIAHKTFFNHFPSKQHLLRELAEVSLAELFDDIESIRHDPRPTRERLRALFVRIAERAAEAGPMTRELVTELVHVVNESPERSTHARRMHEAFGAIVRDGLAAGEVTRRHDSDTLTELILGSYYVLMFNYANLDDFPIRKQAEAVARLLGDALAPSPQE